jgi:hypothetical protein
MTWMMTPVISGQVMMTVRHSHPILNVRFIEFLAVVFSPHLISIYGTVYQKCFMFDKLKNYNFDRSHHVVSAVFRLSQHKLCCK